MDRATRNPKSVAGTGTGVSARSGGRTFTLYLNMVLWFKEKEWVYSNRGAWFIRPTVGDFSWPGEGPSHMSGLSLGRYNVLRIVNGGKGGLDG